MPDGRDGAGPDAAAANPGAPGPRWQRLRGRPSLTVVLVSLYVIENSGIRLLASILRRAGVTVHEIYFKDWVSNRVEPPTEREIELLVSEIVRIGPGLVGLSVRASAFHAMARDLTTRIRAAWDGPVLWGGMHASSCPEEAAAVADLVCIGESERSFAMLADRLRSGGDLATIPGLWVHTADGLVRHPAADLVEDLDSLPHPDYGSPDKVVIEWNRVRRGRDPCVDESLYLVMASRGCPFPSCTFCSNSVVDRMYPGRHYHRTRSVGHVIDEIAAARRVFPRLRRIRFDDEEFPVASAWLDEFCARWPAEVGLPFEIHMDPRVVTPERLARLRDVGLSMVFMGIQGTERINRDLYHRHVPDDQVLRAARAIHESGVRAGYQVILDDPVSTSADKRALFDLLLRIDRPYELVLFSLTVYPGSAIAEELKRRALITDADIEGRQTKVFRQFRVDLSYPRPPEDRFWTALHVMVSKSFIPKALLRAFARSARLARHPAPLTALAYAANVIKVGAMGFGLLVRGELTWAVLRRWLHPRNLVTF